MSEFSCYQSEVKKDIEVAIHIWKEILQKYEGNNIEFAYTKGSAMKKWQSSIDYVPILSDIDIHVKLKDGKVLLENAKDKFLKANEIASEYEENFVRHRPEYFHIPRIQLVILNPLLDDPSFVLPSPNEVQPFIGELLEVEQQTDEEIRKIDLQNILELEEVLITLPERTIERTGIDLWTLIRRLNWRVSPTPIRLLTQIEENPKEIWKLNRTTIVDKLNKVGFTKIANHYRKYYLEGWKAFLSDFKNARSLRNLIVHGYLVLKLSLEEAKLLIKQKP
ncbi:MAG: hypothetical protein ACTSYD_07560 [Candidatus Heimdallarchaeaceae archaeon]